MKNKCNLEPCMQVFMTHSYVYFWVASSCGHSNDNWSKRGHHDNLTTIMIMDNMIMMMITIMLSAFTLMMLPRRYGSPVAGRI